MAQSPESHDLDKLTRWHEGLTSQTGGGFPVCALFLVTAEDRRAHDIFRIYRTEFEELGAGFHDLVIFGQHGVSSTSTALVPGLGLSGLQIPALALITSGDPPTCYTAALPVGVPTEEPPDTEEDGVAWKKALGIISSAAREGSPPALDDVIGLDRRIFPTQTLVAAVGLVKQKVENL
jgi:hypothetical protein